MKKTRKYKKSGLYKKSNLLKQSRLYKNINLSMLNEENEQKRLKLQEESGYRKLVLKETAIIISGILGSILLIGIFWGKLGLMKVGITLFIMMLIVIFIVSATDFN